MNNIVENDEPIGSTHQIIPYCLHTVHQIQGNTFLSNESANNCNVWTFAQLKEKKVISQQLLEWSIPIDLIERYQMFLNDPDASHSLSSTEIFNCTEGWFGSRCQYTFDANGLTFDDVVYHIFRTKLQVSNERNSANGTCYIHLSCDRGPAPSCLDWREICDRKRDCINGGIDEQQYCIELEVSECEMNEYRCSNGQCIPHTFFQDNIYDCSDGTDEKLHFSDVTCISNPSFICEEHVCPRWSNFACGDGECQTEMTPKYGATSVCKNGRNQNMIDAILSRKNNLHLSIQCIFAMLCMTGASISGSAGSCSQLCMNTSDCTAFLQTIRCPSPFFFFPAYPIAHGHVRFAYHTNVTDFTGDTLFTPYLICFDRQLCDLFSNWTISFNGSTCHYYSDVDLSKDTFQKWAHLVKAAEMLFLRCSVIANNNCTSLFQCEQSNQCISKHRLLDGVDDCFNSSDEQFRDTCSFNDPYRFQCSSDKRVCISLMLVNDIFEHCPSGEDEERSDELPLFSMLCDWYGDIFPVFIDGREQSDETDCGSYFPCNNQYRQCDNVWDCPNGIDEADCHSSLCPAFHHPCVSLINNSIECLPLALAGDGIIHCRGGSDERHDCRNSFPDSDVRRYRCSNRAQDCISLSLVCSRYEFASSEGNKWCDGDDDAVCSPSYFQNESFFNGICWPTWHKHRSIAEELLCSLDDLYGQTTDTQRRPKRYLTLRHAGYFPFSTAQQIQPEDNISDDENNSSYTFHPMDFSDRIWLCNRGIVVFTGVRKEKRCFCPPAYYGDQCQYQNQRVSLILQFSKSISADRYIAFQLVIMLIDEKQIVQSYDYISYMPVRDCSIKFRLNLLYASQPKDPKKNYSVRIDAFNIKNLVYHSSWYLPIRFQDLPVNHLVAHLFIRSQRAGEDSKHCSIDCGRYGQCVKYENMQNYFCRCLPGWLGYFCNVSHQCQCSIDSICVGVIANRSICVCPLNKFGTFCHLNQLLCQPNTCNYRGVCVSNDERISKNSFICICNEGYSGSRCEFLDTKIDISFDDVPIPSAIFAHFIVARDDAPHIRTTMFKKIAFDKDAVTILRSTPFHILFVEFLNNYYLAVVQEKYNASMIISTNIFSSYQCAPISLLFNNTILNYNHLHRMKYYHIPCEEISQLMCFYDEVFMCLCNLDRHANCFEFKHNMTYDCQSDDFCKNGAKCFQDDPTCPVTSVCVCAECYFGTLCQFTTKSFDLSLDFIVGYYIHPNVLFSHQPVSLKICLVLTIITLIVGLISGCLSIITFKSKKLREVGCGNYLLVSSIICPLHIILFALKFLLLVLSQMALINNRSFLSVSCKSMDFVLKVLPNMRDWFYTCIAVERLIMVNKGINFDKIMSKRISKVLIHLVKLFVIGTAIYDPIYRRLIDDTEEQRIWCVADYPRSLQIFNSVMDIFHFSIPFFINIICAVIIIIITARTRWTVRKHQSYHEHLFKQFQRHKHLLISPFILTLLALPRLIISFVSGCMKSARNPWLVIISYFMSLISSASMFAVFVLPSKVYSTTFHESIRLSYLNVLRLLTFDES